MAQMSGADIPIDIHYNKLLDWLVNRRHCKQQWQGSALVVREKINNAIQDMPPHEEITKLLQGTYINYFHCLQIIAILKETESATKNIFGRYSSQRMKDWLEIVNLYEKDEIYLAEAAQLLMRNVNYEIPALKRQITKCQQTQKDCTRKESEYASNAAELKEKFNASCKQMGIKGKKLKSELVELVQDLPSVYERIGHSACNLNTAITYYSTFIVYTLKNEKLKESCVPELRFLCEHGNVTTYEWRTGAAPSRVEEPQQDFGLENEDQEEQDNEAQEIDWGDIGEDSIDFSGISLEDGADAIDWGTDTGGEGTGDIDWGTENIEIEVVEDSSKDLQTSQDEGVAKGSDALTLLDNSDIRNDIINQMMEVESFLVQRLHEMQAGTDNVLASSQFQSAPAAILVDPADVQSMLTEVQEILKQLNSTKMQELVMIRSSPRYVEKLTEKLKKTLESSEKMMSLSRLMVTKRQEALDEEKLIEPKLDLIRRRNKELQKQIEGEISKKYHDRRVNIMGEINTI